MIVKTFHPPFSLDAHFYDAKGEELEWAYWWGDCPDAVKVVWQVHDSSYQVLSSHNTHDKAEKAMAEATLRANH